MSDTLLVEDSGAVRILTMNRPDKLNALNTELTTAIRDAFIDADDAAHVLAVVLVGAGRAFCAGADLSEFKDLTPEHQARVRARAALTAEVQALPTKLSIPVIAAASGVALGGGAGLALACDMVVAADDLRLGYPELKHSIVPALVMTGLERHFPRKVAFELVATGHLLRADELLGWGAINQVVAPGEEVTAAVELADRLVAIAPVALATAKSLFYRVSDLPSDAAIRAGQDVNALMRSFRS